MLDLYAVLGVPPEAFEKISAMLIALLRVACTLMSTRILALPASFETSWLPMTC
jgi:hypothetical protein